MKLTDGLFKRYEELQELTDQLRLALKKDGGEEGEAVQQVIDLWMEKEDSVLSAEDIDFTLDDLQTP